MGNIFGRKQKEQGIESLIEEIREFDVELKENISTYENIKTKQKKIVSRSFFFTILLWIGYTAIWTLFIKNINDLNFLLFFSPILILPIVSFILIKAINYYYERNINYWEKEIEEMRTEQQERIKKMLNNPIYKQIASTMEQINPNLKQTIAPKEQPKEQPKTVPQPTKLEPPKKESDTQIPKKENIPPNIKLPLKQPPPIQIDITSPVPRKIPSSPNTPPKKDIKKSGGLFGKLVEILVPDSPTKEFDRPEINFINGMSQNDQQNNENNGKDDKKNK
eukprot:TRINITY_DN4281_c0_g1_i1.p1 TRINITY_DN4281_c0_g1~~TRINITY_DN4281_c0_g1_i1.p1  ORF type:complete len:278 (+),score=90.58 TRINITY_DN4281_c0_g1_i1:20-853(+)